MPDDEVHAVRCGDCHEEYRFDRDLISGRFMWFKPKVKRKKGSCQHPDGHAQVLTRAEGWHEVRIKDGA